MPINPIKPLTPISKPAGGQEQPPVNKLPPPPQPTEPFPGYNAQIEALTKSSYQAEKTVKEASDTLSKVRQMGIPHPLSYQGDNPWLRFFFGTPKGTYAPITGGLATEEDYNRRLAEAQANMDAGTNALNSAEWQLQVLNTLPSYMASGRYNTRSAEEVLNLIPNSNLTDSDRLWLEDTISKMSSLNNILPVDFTGTVSEAQDKIIQQVLEQPRLGLKAVHNLTVDELIRSFRSYDIDMPEGLTADDVRNVLSQTELPDADQELSAYLTERASAWAKETARINLIRAGMLQPESPDLTPFEFTKLLLVQPLMGTIEILDKYFNLLPRPIAANVLIGWHNLVKTPDDKVSAQVSDAFQHYKSMGENDWSAYALAMNSTEMPWYMRMGIETVFDPTTYIGLGVATSMAKGAGWGLSKIGLRTIGARVGPAVAALEGGYVAGADALFQVGKEVVLSPLKGSFWLAGAGYQIPKTLTQMSRNFARAGSMEFKTVLDRMYPEVKNLKGLTAKDIREAAQASIDAFLTRPTEGLDPMVRAGAKLLENTYMTAEDAAKLLKGIATEGFEFDTIRLSRLNDELMNTLSGQGTRTTAGNILSKLGMESSGEAVESVTSKLLAFKDDIVDDAMRVFKSDKPADQLIGMFNRLEENRLSNLTNSITKHLTQAGETISWVSRVADRVLQSSGLVALERRVVMPFARWNLLFANFGPFNFLENMQRSFLGGAEVMYPKSYGGVAETNRLFRGLTNAPYELQMAERGAQRLEMALVDPKTGSTSAFRGGKIPFITKEVSVGGKTIGKKINIRGVDYKITDMQSYNDMWEQLTTIQRAYDYQVHYMKALPKVAPEEMSILVENLAKHRATLEQVGKFSKSDMKDIERTMLQESTIGPEAVAYHQNIDTLEMERRLISKELGKTFDKATEVRSVIKKGLRDEVLDGSIFTDIPGRIAAWKEASRELDLASLAKQIDALNEEAENFAKIYSGTYQLTEEEIKQGIKAPTVPQNLDELLGDLDNISAVQGAVEERIHDYRRLAELRSHKLHPGKEVDDFHVGSNKLLGQFMDTAQEQIDRMVENLQQFTRKPIIYGPNGQPLPRVTLSDSQLKAVDGLADVYRLETRNVLATRNRLAEVEAKITKTPPKSRNARFWKQQRIEKATIWDEYEIAARKLRNLKLDSSRQFLSSVNRSAFVPGNIPPVTDKLAPTHIAYLFGVTGDDVYRGLTRVHHQVTIRPKEDFVDYIRNQANAYAAKFQKSAADIGFTDDAIGDVYDQLWRNLGLEPSVLTPDSPTMLQLDDIGQELTRLHATTKMSESDMAHWRQYVNGVAEDVRQMPMYQKQAVIPDYDIGLGEKVYMKPGEYKKWWEEKGQYYTDPVKEAETKGWITTDQEYLDKIRTELTQAAKTVKMPTETVNFGWLSQHMIDDPSIRNGVLALNIKGLNKAEDFRTALPKTLTGALERLKESGHPAATDLLFKYRTHGFETLAGAIDDWFAHATNDSLQAIGSIASRTPEYLAKIRGILSEKYPSGYIRIYRGSGKAKGKFADREFTNITSSRKTAQEFQDTWGDAATVLADPRTKKPAVDNILVRVDDIVSIGSVEESELIIKASVLKDRIANPLTAPTKQEGITPWFAKKEQAMSVARTQHELAYPTYDDANIIDETMRAIFPFWTYEAFRWRWIPRTFMRTPGTMTGLARFMDYTDGGYIPVPGNDLQLNPLRGSIWMGGMRRFFLKDFPEYYDAFPGMEFIDSIGRAGFYPGIQIMAPIALFGYLADKKPELSEIAPTWVQSGLSALRALSPEHIGKVIDIVYPDRFRDYQTMLTLGEQGYDADAIWKKKQQGIKLTEEEDKLWLKAEAKANGLKGILMQQTGLFRLRPQQYAQVQQEMRLAIQDATGVPVRVQQQIDRMYPTTGKRFSDYYGLDVLQQKLLYDSESIRNWQGVTTSLYPSSWQAIEIKISDYYETLSNNSQQARHEGVYENGILVTPSVVDINQQLVDRVIGPDQWKSMRDSIVSNLASSAEAIGQTPAYKDVPKTLDERVAWMVEKGIATPTFGPDQELLWFYYELKPEPTYNWDSGRVELDFDTYYAKVDALLESLDEAHRQRLLDRIQSDWTPMEKLYWNTSREYLKPYRNIRNIVMSQYSDEERQLIRRYEVARGDERTALQDTLGSDGQPLISGFNTKVREARQRLRFIDPELDAWSYFWGNTDSFLTPTAKNTYNELVKQYLTPTMVE